jgi:predicted deacylase
MSRRQLIKTRAKGGYHSEIVHSTDFISVRADCSGFLKTYVNPGQMVEKGQLLAHILDPYEGYIRSELTAPVHGVISFVGDEPMTYENTAVLKLIREKS